MNKRVFTITVEYDISDIPQDILTSIDKAKEIMSDAIKEICCDDEGYIDESVKVEVKDE